MNGIIAILIVLLIITITWALFERLQKVTLIYYTEIKHIPPSDNEWAECVKKVIRHYLHLK